MFYTHINLSQQLLHIYILDTVYKILFVYINALKKADNGDYTDLINLQSNLNKVVQQ